MISRSRDQQPAPLFRKIFWFSRFPDTCELQLGLQGHSKWKNCTNQETCTFHRIVQSMTVFKENIFSSHEQSSWLSPPLTYSTFLLSALKLDRRCLSLQLHLHAQISFELSTLSPFGKFHNFPFLSSMLLFCQCIAMMKRPNALLSSNMCFHFQVLFINESKCCDRRPIVYNVYIV